MRTIIPPINTNSLVPRTFSEQVSAQVKYPLTISHYKLTAKIYKSADGYYHAVWNTEGKRVKKQFKRLKDAKLGAREALKLIHKGRGDTASLPSGELSKLMSARNMLCDGGHKDFFKVAHEYLAAKETSHGADLMEMASRDSHRFQFVSFLVSVYYGVKSRFTVGQDCILSYLPCSGVLKKSLGFAIIW